MTWRQWWKQILCRHTDMLIIEKDRIYLECAHCGKQGPGVTLIPGRPRVVMKVNL